MSGANYSLTTFSPSGSLLQIDYALEAVGQGRTSLGIKVKEGVVIATEKMTPSVLVDQKSRTKIASLSSNCGLVYSGMGPDYRVLLRKGRKIAQEYYMTYKDEIPVSQIVREMASVMQEFTQSGGVRPFGVSLLIAGIDDEGPQLYQVDPSGSYFAWKASAIGKHSISAKTFLEKRYFAHKDMGLEDAVHTAILTLKENFEGAITNENIEIGIISLKDKTFKTKSKEEISDLLKEVE
mmetsp:Transcript_27622/g.38566  ORF Transcript_27622/g.38566 Transcript_27622/m.38566 type:complete len:237 (-) Transcript_27622:114-824(-)|eukprot:CAMPEP_0185263404 /NCGR_PEP_ID=MMETSP1359-20130426/15041_1 /TAXON_ID=552665 /ORGANISM="Bigelowiella longifila, Strain CCMP242" /LENGTH=236 /DNA_ID=CAMNT_0027850929 /DNA_START=14 /DNA_END=724 /DNA_ORIENTATION=-